MHNLKTIQVKQAQPKQNPWKLADGGSLYLLINPNGSKYWRYDYRYGGKKKTMAIGVYPEVCLTDLNFCIPCSLTLVASCDCSARLLSSWMQASSERSELID